MADNDIVTAYSVSRDSYMSTEIQGYLEKKGVLGNKSKLWCSVQKSTLCMQKKQGDTAKIIDLKESHHVRKVTSDITGTHFEIFEKKKTHVFVCPTSEKCTAWVRSLQAAMALKDSGPDHATDNKDDAAVYEICNYNLSPQMESSETLTHINDYTDPYDMQNNSSTSSKENLYWEVGDVQENLDKQQPTVQLININNNNNISLTDDDAENIYSDAKSEAPTRNTFLADLSYLPQVVNPTPPSTSHRASKTAHRTSSSREKDGCNICPDTFKDLNSANSDNNNDNSQEIQSDGDDDDNPYQILNVALSGRNSPVPDFIHPLTDEDWKPVKDLAQFLSINQEFCRTSFSLVPVTDDPVNSLKRYLETVGMTSRQSGHS